MADVPAAVGIVNGDYFGPETRPVLLPFYLVVDVSASMWHGQGRGKTPWAVLQECLGALHMELGREPEVQDLGALSLIAFGEEARVLLPLTPMSGLGGLPGLPQLTSTDYRRVFDCLHDQLRQDGRRLGERVLLKRPVVFFMSDGLPGSDEHKQPRSEWGPAIERVHSLQTPQLQKPIVVALGFGTANAENLRAIATSSDAYLAEPGHVPRELIKAIVRSIQDSIVNTTTRIFHFPAPAGMTRV